MIVVVGILVASLFALACGALATAWLRGHLVAAAVALFFGALAAWVAAFVAIAGQYQGANDFATCEDDCSAIHLASAVGFIAPPLLISLAAFAVLVSRGSRWRARRLARRKPA